MIQAYPDSNKTYSFLKILMQMWQILLLGFSGDFIGQVYW